MPNQCSEAVQPTMSPLEAAPGGGREARPAAQGYESKGRVHSAAPAPADGNDPRSLSFTCVNCPIGCMLEVRLDADGGVAEVTGYDCARGLEYAKQEAVEPRRNISALVMVPGALEPLSVKTAHPIPKERIPAALADIKELNLVVPIAAGQIVLQDIANTGISLVATKSLAE